MKINIGSDIFYIKELVNIDIRFEVHPDVVMDITKLALPNNSCEEIHLGNILEHLNSLSIHLALLECYRVLSSNGIMYITIPRVDIAEDCFQKGTINQKDFNKVIYGTGDGPSRHERTFKSGDLEKILSGHNFHCEKLDLWSYPYLIVSNTNDPKPDPWQYGVRASKF